MVRGWPLLRDSPIPFPEVFAQRQGWGRPAASLLGTGRRGDGESVTAFTNCVSADQRFHPAAPSPCPPSPPTSSSAGTGEGQHRGPSRSGGSPRQSPTGCPKTCGVLKRGENAGFQKTQNQLNKQKKGGGGHIDETINPQSPGRLCRLPEQLFGKEK